MHLNAALLALFAFVSVRTERSPISGPIVFVLTGLVLGPGVSGRPVLHVLATVIEEIGIGLVVGAALTVPASSLLRLAFAKDFVGHTWTGLPAAALALACFALAQHLGGSGFIACFVGGLVFGARQPAAHALLRGAETVEATIVCTVLLSVIAHGGNRQSAASKRCGRRRRGRLSATSETVRLAVPSAAASGRASCAPS
jgi:NhaP-type Na+/H+ or K+/H+ antiporter